MKTSKILIILGAIIGMHIGFWGESAYAATYPIADRDGYHGYFTNIHRPSNPNGAEGAFVLEEGIPASVSSKETFITFIESRLNHTDPQIRVGSRFILQVMRGPEPSTGMWDHDINVSAQDIQDWKNKVNNPQVSVDWNYEYAYPATTTYMARPNYGAPSPEDEMWINSSGTSTSIVFFNAQGKIVFAIERECANVTAGNPAALPEAIPPPPPPPPTALTCGTLNIRPQHPEIGDLIVLTPTIRYSGGPPTLAINSSSLDVRNGASQPGVIANTAAASNGTIRFTSSSFTVPVTGVYTVRWSVTVNQGTGSDATITCGGRFAPGDSFSVLTNPFFRVNGGDTIAGASFSTPNGSSTVPCSSAVHNPKAGVVGFSRGVSPTYTGAGGGYAVYAMNYIQEFVSDQGKGRPPTSLAFANTNYVDNGQTSVDPAAGRFGGMFGSAPCVDLWGKKPSDGQLTALNAGTPLNNLSGEYLYTGNLTIGNSLIQSGNKLTIYVKGDVNITGNIAYQSNSGSWVHTADIPNFRLVVNGRIFINAAVTQLDGMYAAIPNADYATATNTFGNPQAGTIATCSNGFAAINPEQIITNNMANTCAVRLTVNGSFVANQMWLLRSFGTLSSNEPAEIFNYTPELWLASGGASLDSAYDTVIGLPPVL